MTIARILNIQMFPTRIVNIRTFPIQIVNVQTFPIRIFDIQIFPLFEFLTFLRFPSKFSTLIREMFNTRIIGIEQFDRILELRARYRLSLTRSIKPTTTRLWCVNWSETESGTTLQLTLPFATVTGERVQLAREFNRPVSPPHLPRVSVVRLLPCVPWSVLLQRVSLPERVRDSGFRRGPLRRQRCRMFNVTFAKRFNFNVLDSLQLKLNSSATIK